MKTYQDLLALETEAQRMQFILSAIEEHKSSSKYHVAKDADLYYKQQNPTIMRYQKYIYTQRGQKVPNIYAANNKLASNWYYYFTAQAVQYLLGNGLFLDDPEKKQLLGADFDAILQKAATEAKNGSVSFGFWNMDHLEVFSYLEFVPLYDEEDGGLKAGIRFWQIEEGRPLRATLYELDGYTDYLKRPKKDMETLNEKRPYKLNVQFTKADGEVILGGNNYPGFPIVPFRNISDQSDLVGKQGTIDAYDLMSSGLINNVSEGNFIYWVLKNCGGMNSEDDAKFVEQMLTTHVAHVEGDDGVAADAHKVETPFQASEAALAQLENQLFHDFMGLRVEKISAGNMTATQINAAYDPLNLKTDQFEFQALEFLSGIFTLAGIDAKPSFKRSRIVNQLEETQMVLMAAEHLDEETLLNKLSWLTPEEVTAVLERKASESLNRFGAGLEV